MIIAKFGGTSVNTKDRVETLCQIVGRQLSEQPIVVVSALRGVTDLLLSLPTQLKSQVNQELKKLEDLHTSLISELFTDATLKEKTSLFISSQLGEIAQFVKRNGFSKAALDKLVSYGEIMSSYIIAHALEEKGIKANQVVATNLVVTDNNFTAAEFLPEPTCQQVEKVLTPLIKKGIVPVVTGFIGVTENGQVTTLGRGGSDYTAAILGFCLKVSEIQIWTDVDGIFTTDPKLVKKAKLLLNVSYKEASEMATFGARVLHPRTIRPAVKSGIPVRVLNTLNSKSLGSKITDKHNIRGIVRAVCFKRKITLVNIYSAEMLLQKGFLAKVFEIFSRNNISVDLVSVSEVSISLTLDNSDGWKKVAQEISKFASVGIIEDFGMISLIGEGITSKSQTIKKIFDILDQEKILARMISLGATDINISIVIQSDKVEKAVKVLHDQLLLRQA